MPILEIGPAFARSEAGIVLILLLEFVPAEIKNPTKKTILMNKNSTKLDEKQIKLYLIQIPKVGRQSCLGQSKT